MCHHKLHPDPKGYFVIYSPADFFFFIINYWICKMSEKKEMMTFEKLQLLNI